MWPLTESYSHSFCLRVRFTITTGNTAHSGIPFSTASHPQKCNNVSSNDVTPPTLPRPCLSCTAESLALLSGPRRHTGLRAEAVALVAVVVVSGATPAVAVITTHGGAAVVLLPLESEGELAGGPVAVAAQGEEHCERRATE